MGEIEGQHVMFKGTKSQEVNCSFIIIMVMIITIVIFLKCRGQWLILVYKHGPMYVENI